MRLTTPVERPPTRPWVAYVGPFSYPDGGAASRRVRGMAETLSVAGFDVVVANGSGSDAAATPRCLADGEGIEHCQLNERVAEHLPRPLRRLRYARMGGRTLEWLDSRPRPPKAVILYSGYTPYLQRLLPWCRRNQIPLIFDAVEWYEPKNVLGYFASPYQWNIEWAMRHLIPQTDGVIAISEFLADYYRRRGLPVVVIPPTTSMFQPGSRQSGEDLRLVYAGTPGRKDELAAPLREVARLVDHGAPVTFMVVGPSRESIEDLLGPSRSAAQPWLITPGTVPYMNVREMLGESDFSVLLRRPCRTSRAGFPTKVVESLASGTPVIGNVTSDLASILRDGETALVCGNHEAPCVAETLRRALSLDVAKKRAMRHASLAMARGAFAPPGYANAVQALMEAATIRRGTRKEKGGGW